MNSEKNIIISVDSYISSIPEPTQALLQQLRTAIKTAAPEAEEVISYQMPAYKYHGILVYFAGYMNHIGFYPTSSAIEVFKTELKIYKFAKGSVQFPINKPLPLELIDRMVKFRTMENWDKAQMKKKNKKMGY